jgi:cytochrome b
MASGGRAGTAIWDWPVRLVHWSFVLLVPALWASAEFGNINAHRILGLVMLGLVVFRLLWGLIGSETARFSQFVKGPDAVMAYLRGARGGPNTPAVGHNPLGALSVLALLGLLATQVSIGLFTQDVDGLESGPLAYLVSYDTADAARGWHELGFNLLLALIAIHLAAIAYYQFAKRENLVRPMITGRRVFDQSVRAPMMAPIWRFALCASIAAGLAWWIGQSAPLP